MTELSKTVSLERRGEIALLWTDNPRSTPSASRSRPVSSKGLPRSPAMTESGLASSSAGGRVFSPAPISRVRPGRAAAWLAGIRPESRSFSEADHRRGFIRAPSAVARSGARLPIPDRRKSGPCSPSRGRTRHHSGRGGTQRFPRIAGFEAALDIIPSARVFGTAEALKLGIADRAIDSKLEDAAISFAREIIAKKPKPADCPAPAIGTKRSRRRGQTRRFLAGRRATVRRRFRGFNGRLRAIDAIENALSMPFDEAFTAEIAISMPACARRSIAR